MSKLIKPTKNTKDKTDKYNFELNIDTKHTCLKYIDSNKTDTNNDKNNDTSIDTNIDTNTDTNIDTTKVSDLNPAKKGTPKIVSFLDESKRAHSCKLSMIDFESKLDINLTSYNCFWCRHSFEYKPIGCPIRFVPSQAVKQYYSHISKSDYTIKEHTNSEETIKNVTINKANYYETDGVFCSFNCCKAYIDDNKHKRIYDDSTMLLLKIYNDLMESKCSIITPAPHWKMLEVYGGVLDITKFRQSFNKIEYNYHGTVKQQNVSFKSIGHIYEEVLQF